MSSLALSLSSLNKSLFKLGCDEDADKLFFNEVQDKWTRVEAATGVSSGCWCSMETGNVGGCWSRIGCWAPMGPQLFGWSFGSHNQRLWLRWRAITSTALLLAASTFLHHRGRIENIGGWRCGHISYQYRFHVCTRIFSRHFFDFITAQQAKNIVSSN